MFTHRFTIVDRLALVAVAALSLTAAVPSARATCGSATCFLVTGTREGLSQKGQLKLDLSFRYLNQSRMLSGSRTVPEVLTPGVNFEEGRLEPDHHREIRTQTTQVQLDLGYGLSERLSVVALLPLINQKDHEHFDDVGTPDEHFSKTDGSAGFGDVQVGLRYALLLRPDDMLIAGANVKLPSGSYRLSGSQGDINEPTIQPGTGSTDFIGSLHYSHQLLPMKLDAFASGAFRATTENPLRYRLGDEAVLTLGLGLRTGSKFTWLLELNGRHGWRDEFLGSAVPSTGSTMLNVTPGFSVRTSSGMAFYGFVQVPVHQHVNESQLAPKAGFVVGVSHSI